MGEQARTIVFVLGAPGAGKGTQCSKIVESFGWTHLSTGDLLRAEVAAGSELGMEAQALMQAGEMVPTRLVLDLLVNAMSSSGATRFLVDGFPRKLDQLQEFEEKIQPADLVLVFSLDEEVAVSRLVKRGETSGRADDNEDTIRSRMQVFREESQPVIDALKETGRVAEVDASAEVEDVFQLVAPVMERMHDKASEKEAAAANNSASEEDTPTADTQLQDTHNPDESNQSDQQPPQEEQMPDSVVVAQAAAGEVAEEQEETQAVQESGDTPAEGEDEPLAQMDASGAPVLHHQDAQQQLGMSVNPQVTDLTQPLGSHLVNAQITDAVSTAVNFQITDAVTAVNPQVTDFISEVPTGLDGQVADVEDAGEAAPDRVTAEAFPTAVNGQVTDMVAAFPTAVNDQITDAIDETNTAADSQVADLSKPDETAVNSESADAVPTPVNGQITDALNTAVNSQITDAVSAEGVTGDDSTMVHNSSEEHADSPDNTDETVNDCIEESTAQPDKENIEDAASAPAPAKLELQDGSKVVFVLGAPGAGKGTQCARIVADYGWTHLSTGDLLRAEVAAGTPLGIEAAAIMREGGFLPTSVMLGLLVNAMSSSGATRFLVDGFPRKLDQLQEFEEKVRPADMVLVFSLDEEVAVSRLVKRGETSGRADDNEDTIRSRMQVFREESQPVIDALKETGRVAEIDASAEVDAVYSLVQRIVAQLEGLLVDAVQEQLAPEESSVEQDKQDEELPAAEPSAAGLAYEESDEEEPAVPSRSCTAEGPPDGVMTMCSHLLEEAPQQQLAAQRESMKLSQASRHSSTNARQQQGPASMAKRSSLEPVQEVASADVQEVAAPDVSMSNNKPPTPPAAPPPGNDTAAAPPRSPLASRGTYPAATVASFKQPGASAKSLPVRQYMDSTVVPVLREALRALNDSRPNDPLQFLADQLLAARSRVGGKAAGAL